MDYSTIEFQITERTAIVTMNRPDRRNSLNDVMIKELTDVFGLLQRNQQVRVTIITGAADSFCAGMDLEYLKRQMQLGHEENIADARNLLKLLLAIHNHKKIVIAMVNGPAIGGGCGLASACDFVIGGREKAKLGTPEVKLGFLPAIILLFLVKRLGEGRAREFMLRGSIYNAEGAKNAGLLTEVVGDDELLPFTMEFAKKLAATTSPSSITLTKELFTRFDDLKRTDALDYAVTLNALVRKTADFSKGIQSFLSKEKLEW
jgi:methylglutaconyl-CoA hydratase